ncbi:MAG: cytochrome b561 [Candidatus Azotimanducaceae bacterium]|jgi:cytochrome b561
MTTMTEIKNTQKKYGLFSIIFHWVIAISVIGLFGSGLWMVELGYYDSWYTKAPDLHRSVGLCLLLWVLISLAWRFLQLKPEHLTTHNKFERLSGYLMHYVLSMLLVLVLFSGYFISTAQGSGIEVFSWFEVPGFGSFIENQEDKSGLVHWVTAYLLAVAATGHGLAALKHHFIDNDDTLNRILIRRP